MTRRNCMVLLVLLAAAVFAWPALAAEKSVEEELKELRKRFEERRAALVRLKDKGWVGEVHTGYTDAVKSEHQGQKVDEARQDSPSVRDFVAAENADRKRLYEIFAEQQRTSAAQVAERNFLREYRQGSPEHYFQVRSGKWMQKKDVKDEIR